MIGFLFALQFFTYRDSEWRSERYGDKWRASRRYVCRDRFFTATMIAQENAIIIIKKKESSARSQLRVAKLRRRRASVCPWAFKYLWISRRACALRNQSYRLHSRTIIPGVIPTTRQNARGCQSIEERTRFLGRSWLAVVVVVVVATKEIG